MTWVEFQLATLHRLLTRLRHHQQLYEEVIQHCKRYGYPPSDPLYHNAHRCLASVVEYIVDVEVTIRHLTPPTLILRNPLKTQGGRTVLRPGFTAADAERYLEQERRRSWPM